MMARKRSRHGLHGVMATVKVRGLSAIDGRSLAARSLMQWRKELLRDLGGEEHLSAQKMAMVEMVVRSRLFIDHIDSWLLQQDSLLNKKKKCMIPILRERQSLVDSLARLLCHVGLERVARPMPTLEQYVASKAEAKQ
jgi:hypothetical protein